MHAVPGLEAQRGVGRRSPDPGTSVAVIRVRMLAAAIIGVLIAVIPVFGPHRVAIGLVAGVVSVSVDAYALRSLRRTGHPTPLLALADLALTLAVIAAAPQTLAVGAAVYTSIVSLNVFWYGRRSASALAAAFTAGMLVIGLVATPALWVASVLAFALCASTAIVVLSTLARGAADNRKRYDDLVNGLDAVLWEADDTGTKNFVSGNVSEVLGTTADTFASTGFHLERVHPEDRAELEAARERNDGGQSTETHVRLLDDDGEYRHVHERVRVSRKLDGTLHRKRGLVVDESARWNAEAELRRYVDFVQGIPVALAVLRLADPGDPRSLQIAAMNPAAEAVLGPVTPDTPLRSHMELSEVWMARIAAVAEGGQPLERPFVELPGVDGVFALRAIPLPEHHIGISFEDVTKRARLAASFRHQARHDALTGLPNRAHFNERLTHVMSRTEVADVALLVIDLDRFKEINDALGHEYGDRVLEQFGHRLANSLRNCDLVSRLGGDEFAVLLTGAAGQREAIDIASRVLELCDTDFSVGTYRFRLGVSVGVALSEPDAADAETLMRHADTAMYRAKAAGGGSRLYSTLDEPKSSRRLELMGELGQAIRSDAMEVHYQPQIDLQSNRTVGVEALVRWRHPRHGLLAPGEFIELAELSGTVGELTRYVAQRSSAEITELFGAHNLTLSVNLSARTLYDPSLGEWVEALFDDGSLRPGEFCFEIAETDLSDDPNRSLTALHELRNHGVRFSIDDFGSGASSLGHLRELPIDELKIDRRFVAELQRDDTVARSVIELGHNLGLSVVAEGVEDASTEQRLRHMGCDSAQGFRWGAAMPAVTLAAHLTGAWENPITVR